MEDDRPPGNWSWLRTWPMLLAAAAAVLAGAKLITDTGHRDDLGFALVVIGAVILGAWLALLASHNYSGKG